jgi:pyrroline-5-carboxylate reductase
MDSILICGCGNMGGAMLAGWLAGGFDPARFTVVDPVLVEMPAGVRLLRAVPSGAFDVVLLGIKPQALGEIAPTIEPATRGAIVLSILAGAELDTLSAQFPAAKALVRVMPNLAAAIGKSPLGLFARGLDDAGRTAVETLLAPLGTAEWLASEDQLDAVTALAGSGPAFVYRFIAALAESGAALGLDSAQAERLARAMVEGAALLAAASPETPAELARRVTSPGGTTAAGLAVIDADQALLRLVEATLRAARDRGAELAAAARQQ